MVRASVAARAANSRVVVRRRRLAVTTALAAGLLASPTFYAHVAAADGNECGSGTTVNCAGTYAPGTPSGNTNGGIDYNVTSGSSFTLNLKSTGAVTETNNSILAPDNGITVAGPGGFLSIPYTSGTARPVTVNTNFGSTIHAHGNGVYVWTDGSSNSITINADGSISSGGSGIVAHSGASGGASGAGDITINQTGAIQTTGSAPGIVAWASNTSNGNTPQVTVNNTGNGTIVGSGSGDGIMIADPTLAIANTYGASQGNGTVNNDAKIDVGGNGVFVNVTGAAVVNNQADGSITSGKDGIYVGGMLLGQQSFLGTGSAAVTNDGKINAGGNGITVNVAGASTINNDATGTITSTKDGIHVGGVVLGADVPSGSGTTITNDGTIKAGGNGIFANSLGNVSITNSETGSITSVKDGIHVGGVVAGVDTPTLGSATVTNDGSIDAGGNGIAVMATSGGTITNDTDGTILAGGDGIKVGGQAAGIPTPSLGSYTITNNGAIGNDTTAVGGIGIDAFTVGGQTITNDGSIYATNGGINSTSVGGNIGITSPGDVTTTNGTGIQGLALGGTVTIDSTGSTVSSTNGSGIVGAATGNVTIDSGAVNAGSGGMTLPAGLGGITVPIGGGVVAASLGGDATVNAHDDISVNGGTFGAAAISTSGAATVNIDDGVVIDPPAIGASAIVLGGSSDATVNTGASTIDATTVGVLAVNAGSGNAVVNGTNVTVGAVTQPSLGIGGFALGSGNVDINADSSTVNAGAGVVGLATGAGEVDIDSGTTTATGLGALSFGVAGVALGGGDVNITTHGNTTADGLAGVLGYAGSGGSVTETLGSTTVAAANGVGVLGIATGGGSVDVEGADSTVNAAVGIAGYADTGGGVTINSGTVNATGAGALSVGVAGVALGGGNVAIDTYGNTTADGLAGVMGVADTGNVEIDYSHQTVTANNGVGVLALAGGTVDIDGWRSTVNAAVGVVGVGGGDVNIDTGDVTATGAGALSVGVVGVSTGGNVDIRTHGDTTADGLVGVGAIALNGDATVKYNRDTVTANNGVGVLALAGGMVDIDGWRSTVNAAVGVVGIGGGDVNIDTGDVTATGAGALSVGVMGVSTGGNVDIRTHGDTTADGLVGVGGFASGDVGIDLRGHTVTADNGAGVLAVAGGNVEIDGAGSTVDAASGITGVALGGNSTINSGTVNASGAGLLSTGVVAVAVGGDATVNSGGTISADGGLFGAAAISTGGAATVNLNGYAIDPPVIGGAAIVLGGSSDATVNTGGAAIDATGAGLVALNIGSGNANVNAGTSVIGANTAPVLGIGALAIGGGNVDIEASDTNVTAGAGVVGISVGGSTLVNSGTVNATGTDLAGVGVVGVALGGNSEVDTHGNTDANGLFGVFALSAGGDASITTGGYVNALNGSGVNAVALGGNATIDTTGGDVNSMYMGVGALALDGGATIDTGNVHTTGSGFEGSGVVGIAVDLGSGSGDVGIDAHGNVTSDNGLFGIAALATGGNASVTLEDGITVSALNGAGVDAVALGGDVTISGANSTVNSEYVGVGALALDGGVTIDSGTVTTTGTGFEGSGVVGIAVDLGSGSGDVDITTHGNTTAGGLFGVAAFATGGNATVTLGANTVSAVNGIGVSGLALGGNVEIDGADSTVIAQDLGIGAMAVGGNATVNAGDVTVSNGSGILASALGGDTNVNLYGDVTANGMAGVGAFATGNTNVDLGANTITNTGGIGVGALALGDTVVAGTNSTIHSELDGIDAGGTNVTVDSGVIVSDNGSGVIAIANGGDALVTTHGKITADNGLFGASATSFGGDAIVVVNAAIDPPVFGASAVTFGPGLASVTNNSDIQASFVGMNAANFGTGDVVATNNGTVGAGSYPAPTFGISTFKAGPGSTTITNATGAEVHAQGAAIFAVANDPDPVNVDNITIYSDGLLTGDGSTYATVMTWSDGSLDFHNDVNGVVTNGQTDPNGGAIVWSYAEGTISLTNDGSMTGNMDLTALGSDVGGKSIGFDNDAGADWNFAGVNSFHGAGDIALNNAGTVNALGISSSTFLSDNGNVGITNSGNFNTNGDHTFTFTTPNGASTFDNTGAVNVVGTATFAGLGDFNNTGLLNTVDGDHAEVVHVTGNFNAIGASSVFAFDAELKANGLADLLVVDGNTTGTTNIHVTDLVPSVPGEYVPESQGIVFAMVKGSTSEATPNFTTNGGIDKGLYRFDAYIRDTPVNTQGYQEWVLASTPNRQAFELTSIPFAAQNISTELTDTWLDRTADLRDAFSDNGGGKVPGNVTPGVWGRVFGGTTGRDISNTVGTPSGLSGGGVFTYDDHISQDYYGFMTGFDFGTESLSRGGSNQAWLFGLMGGYTKSNVNFDSSNTKMDFEHWSAGGYVTRLDGPFFADLALRVDFGKLNYGVSTGLVSDSFSTNYTSVNAVLDTGYKIKLGGNAFFEPKATLAYIHTSFDDAELLGTSVSLGNNESLRGRLGGRLGATLPSSGGAVIEPYVEASVWDQFEGHYHAVLTSAGNDLTLGYDTQGAVGEVAAGISYANGNSGWSFFLRGSTQFGQDNYRSYKGNVGLRYQWGGSKATPLAPAEVPPPPPPPPAPPPPPPAPVCTKGPYIVFFDWDKSDITPEAAAVLDSAVTAYGNCSSVPIMLAGYTDRSGTVKYNLGLSKRRNDSVQAYLTGKGIPASAISAQAFGEANPRVPTADGVRELQNRRVEITYGPGSGM